MQSRITLALLPLLAACGQPRDFVGDDLGDDYFTADYELTLSGPAFNGTGSTEDLLENTAFRMTEPGEEFLMLTAGPGTVDAWHEGIIGPSCAVWRVDLYADDDNRTMDVRYVDISGADCDRSVGWTLVYGITDLAAGEWAITAGTQSELVVIP